MDEKIIEVREDEKFNEENLFGFLKERLPQIKDASEMVVKQFGGGAANLTYLLKFGEMEFVLRRPPLGMVAKSSHDMGREHQVLSALYQKFPKSPRSYVYSDDDSIIGTPFFVMERKNGFVIRRKFPDELRDTPNLARKISESLVNTLAEFHKVNYAELGLENLGRPVGFVERQIEGWYKRWQAAKVQDNLEMDRIYNWLKLNYQGNDTHTLVHNDFKLDNTMLSKTEPSTITGVFDWDMCTLGDPLSDLGALLTYWTEPSDPEYFRQMAMMPTDDVGFLTREGLVKRYSMKSGKSVENVNFYHVLGMFRLAVIAAQIYIRFVRKQTQDQRFAAFGKLTELVIKATGQMINEN